MKAIEGGDVSLVRIGAFNSPHCLNHGAMAKVNETGVWRCLRMDHTPRCRAGCEYKVKVSG